MAYTNIQKIAMIADEMKRTAAGSLAKFTKDFAEDPHHAFSWGEQAVKAAAQQHVGVTLEEYIKKVRANQPLWNDDQVADCILQEIEGETIRKARWPDQSTSQISNMVSQQRTAYYAEFIARMRGL